MSFPRFVRTALAGTFIGLASSAQAALFDPAIDPNFHTTHSINQSITQHLAPNLSATATPASLLHGELDRVKSRAAIHGLVTLAAIGNAPKATGQMPKTRAMEEAEQAIAALNVPLITTFMMMAAGGLMWLSLSLQRERV